ncbi:uncharacterized protein LOC144470002 [Augochlora pura]
MPELKYTIWNNSVPSSTQRIHVSPEPPTGLHQTSTSVTVPPSSSPTSPSTASKLSASVTNELTTSVSSESRKDSMPKVTLKLRENETIPQRYMKAGIASYKKGNITTSVLANGLSLEGLIFKTPKGTIKPWPQKWFFTDPAADFQWKRLIQVVPVTIYVVLAGVAAFASGSIVLMFYMQRKTTRRQRQNVEEPEAGGQEEDKSTLLGAESQEIEEKE